MKRFKTEIVNLENKMDIQLEENNMESHFTSEYEESSTESGTRWI